MTANETTATEQTVISADVHAKAMKEFRQAKSAAAKAYREATKDIRSQIKALRESMEAAELARIEAECAAAHRYSEMTGTTAA